MVDFAKMKQDIDAEIERLQEVKRALDKVSGIVPVAPTPKFAAVATPIKRLVKRRKLSAEAREKIRAAQQARWAKIKGTA